MYLLADLVPFYLMVRDLIQERTLPKVGAKNFFPNRSSLPQRQFFSQECHVDRVLHEILDKKIQLSCLKHPAEVLESSES